jgi:PKHD-type hydroxylase
MMTSHRHPKLGTPAVIISHAFDQSQCQKIIEKYKDKTEGATHISGDKIVSSNDMENTPRISEVAWVDDDDIYKRLWGLMLVANKIGGWEYDVSGQEMIQFTKYNSGGKYDWHTDGSADHLSKREFVFGEPPSLRQTNSPNLIDTVRKISCSVLLNDDFEGGQFKTAYLNSDKVLEIKEQTIPAKQGDMIIFPSCLPHTVVPVTKGTRYSLVLWFAGPPLK